MQTKTLNPIAYSIREAVQVSSLSRSTLYNAISAGQLKARKVGGRTLIPRDALLRFVGEE
ncbi:excisionase family DNA binding protein [Sphingobium xanthum]|jgi:excisionase family DNA binding protein|uniref:helix-turn-helix domain-containing protein n=1 Tax=Sphingobium xanthum TaxID=1387165 RepID=UPI001C8C5930|nr:helix-turn-helix domain-containing protein [Sphingobium xanthum]